MNLLIVDDHPINRKLLRAQLEAEGHGVFEAAHGVEALEVLAREKSVEGVVSDILMPNMDGFRLCLEIRKNRTFAALPFIVYTSTYDSPEDRELARSVGADHYLTKPSPTADILGALRDAGQRTRSRIAASAARQDETYVLKQYNEALVRKLEERNLEVEQSLVSIRRLNRVYAVLSGINTLIVRVKERQELFNEACRIAVEHGNFGIAWIGMVDWKTMEVTSLAWAGPEAAQLLRSPKILLREDLPEGKGLIAKALSTGKPVFDNDIVKNPDVGGERRTEAIRLGYRSFIALPLIVERNVVGNLSLFAKEENFFNEDEMKLLTELAGDISFAMEHIATQQNIERLSRVRAVSSEINAAIVRAHDRQGLFYEACRIAVEDGKFGITWIGEFNPETFEITPVASAGLEDSTFLMSTTTSVRPGSPQAQGVVQGAVRERRAVYSNDITMHSEAGGKRRLEAIRRGYRSLIALPLIVDGAVAGTFSMFAKEAGFFNDEEVALLTEVAGNLSFALEHMARQKRIEKLSRVRAVLGGINAAIVRIRERNGLLAESCRIISEQGRFEMVWIGSIESEKQELRPVAWTGFSSESAHAVNWASISAARGPIGRALATRKISVLNDIHAEMPTGSLRQEALAKGYLSAVCLPLLVEDRAVALISIYAAGRAFFDQEELTLLDEATSNISFALEHMARQQKIEKLSRVRAVSSEVNAAIVRIREAETLLQETCRIAAEHGKFELVWVGEIDSEKQKVRAVASTGFSREAAHGVSWTSISSAQGSLGEAIRTRKPAIRNDIQSELPTGGLRQEALRQGCYSTVCLPLVVDDGVAALIVLFAAGTGFFDADELTLLTEMTADVSFALQSIAQQEKVEYLSFYDTVTGLPNRRLFMDRAGQQMRSRDGEPLMVALILVNLERFRNINESLGRQGGDALLKLVAQRLETAFGGKDYLARIGADNFGVVIRGVRDATAVMHAVDGQILACFRDPFSIGGKELRVAARAGVALHPTDGGDADALFRNAEAALKRARVSGDPYLFYAAEMNAKAAQALSMETRLRNAVEAQQFVLHYQPKIELASGRISGLEALIRWQDPESGLVAPGAFIPLLEETGLIRAVGRWALAQALAQHREWTARGSTVPRIAVNVSAIQLQQKDFSEMVINVVQEAGDIPDALELEVTESLLMRDVQESIRKLSILRGLGIHIAMDDFGTGYSSLSYIARLPINSLKIDRSFINGMAGNPQDMSIVSTIIALAHSLNLQVVAEGVETEGQAKLLKLLKCEEAQGYLFSKPLPAIEIETLLRAKAQPAR